MHNCTNNPLLTQIAKLTMVSTAFTERLVLPLCRMMMMTLMTLLLDHLQVYFFKFFPLKKIFQR